MFRSAYLRIRQKGNKEGSRQQTLRGDEGDRSGSQKGEQLCGTFHEHWVVGKKKSLPAMRGKIIACGPVIQRWTSIHGVSRLDILL
jgi:hypothetical protein